MTKPGVLALFAIAGLAMATIAAVTTLSLNRPLPKLEAQDPKLQTGSERTLLTEAQLFQARAEGVLDRDVKSVLNVRKRMEYGDYLWDDRHVPQGTVWIRVDLERQLLSVFRAGHEIGTAVILYGAEQKKTPSGIFPILAKIKDHESSLYDARMPYTLRLTDDGIAIHASEVRWGAATHGCIGVPVEFAQKLFAATHKGDQVVIVPQSDRPVRSS